MLGRQQNNNLEEYEMHQMTAQELKKRLDEGQALNIIDVREVDEVATGKIAGAVNIPLALLEFRMHELEKSKEYIVVCHAGGRSSRAVSYLEDYGFNVINLNGGMLAWYDEVHE